MSKKPSKMRKSQFVRKMHESAKATAAHLSEKLSQELKTRALSVRKGDTAKIMRGEFKGREGKISSVDRKGQKVFIEKITKKKANGAEWNVPIDASKIMLTELDRTDRKRFVKKKEVKG